MSPAAHESSSVATEDNTLKREQGRYCSSWIEWMSDFVCVGNDKPRTNKNRPEEPKLLVLKGTEHVFLGCQGNVVIDVSVAHWKRNISQYMFTGQMKSSLRPTILAEKVIVMESRDDEPTAKEEISSRNDMQHGSPARQKAIGFEIRPFEDVNEENENVSGHLSELESVIILLESRRFQLALNTLSNMLMSDTRQFGENSLQVALHLHNMALLHVACGNLSDALYPFHDALEIKKEVLGLSHPSTIVGNEAFFCSLNRFVSISTTHSAFSPVVYIFGSGISPTARNCTFSQWRDGTGKADVRGTIFHMQGLSRRIWRGSLLERSRVHPLHSWIYWQSWVSLWTCHLIASMEESSCLAFKRYEDRTSHLQVKSR